MPIWTIEYNDQTNAFAVWDGDNGYVGSGLTAAEAFELFKKCWERTTLEIPKLPMQFVVVLKNGHSFLIDQDEADQLERLLANPIHFAFNINNQFLIWPSDVSAMYPAKRARVASCWNPWDFTEAFKRLQSSE